jgi:xanthine dehydrogenase accessory factor
MSTSNHLSHLLAKWYPNRDKFDWVLATIYDTNGPCYRKAGAMMLFSSQGDQLGMLSGGCLESDIATNARKVMQTGQSISLCYDGTDEDDVSFHLGIGCGGTVYIMLQQISAINDYLSLTSVYNAIKQRKSGYYYQPLVEQNVVDKNNTPAQAYFEAEQISDLASRATIVKRSRSPINNSYVTNNNDKWLASPVIPEPHLLIIGGGIDARPLVNMAQQLGWQVSLWDPRPANARKEFFSNVNHIIKGEADILTIFALEKNVNSAVLMSHNVEIDAQALHALSKSKLQYLGLLGPENRRQQVLAQAKIIGNVKDTSLSFKFAGPSGLDIGGTLPESIALSILSECHASLYGKNAQSISNVL